MDEEIKSLLRENNDLLKKVVSLLDQQVKLFSKYDDQYLEEVEKDGFIEPVV